VGCKPVGDYFIAGMLGEVMSGQPGDIPKFITDMIGPLADEDQRPTEELPKQEPSSCRPKSEVAQPSTRTQPPFDTRPKSDISRASDHGCRMSDDLAGKKPSKPF